MPWWSFIIIAVIYSVDALGQQNPNLSDVCAADGVSAKVQMHCSSGNCSGAGAIADSIQFILPGSSAVAIVYSYKTVDGQCASGILRPTDPNKPINFSTPLTKVQATDPVTHIIYLQWPIVGFTCGFGAVGNVTPPSC